MKKLCLFILVLTIFISTDTFGSEGNSLALEGDWRKLNVSGPSARRGSEMVYDSERNVAVLFGGYDGTQFLNDTWEWNGQQWNQITTSASPSPGSDNPMAFDSVRGKVVMCEYDGGMWEYDGLCEDLLLSFFKFSFSLKISFSF